MKILIYPTYLCLLQPLSLPVHPLLVNHISWKSKLKHTGVDITSIFQDAKSSLAKHKRCLLEASHGTSGTS